jgi:hypothetical protein
VGFAAARSEDVGVHGAYAHVGDERKRTMSAMMSATARAANPKMT